MDVCERTGIPITFCPNGICRDRWNPHAQRLGPLIEAGQVQIANHTYTHRSLLGASRVLPARGRLRAALWAHHLGVTPPR